MVRKIERFGWTICFEKMKKNMISCKMSRKKVVKCLFESSTYEMKRKQDWLIGLLWFDILSARNKSSSVALSTIRNYTPNELNAI